MPYTIGELAKRTGVSVRSLHHYDDYGLLTPSARSESGYRLYSAADVARLHRIVAYRQMDLPLKQILNLLSTDEPPLQRVLQEQVAALQSQIARQQRLVDRLNYLLQRAGTDTGVDAEELIKMMAVMNKLDDYLDADEQQQLEQRRAALTAEQIAHIRAQWDELLPQVRAQMALASDPTQEPVQTLALRWLQLLRPFTGGDMQMMSKMGAMYQQETEVQQITGIDAELLSYIGQAFAVCWQQRARWDIDL